MYFFNKGCYAFYNFQNMQTLVFSLKTHGTFLWNQTLVLKKFFRTLDNVRTLISFKKILNYEYKINSIGFVFT